MLSVRSLAKIASRKRLTPILPVDGTPRKGPPPEGEEAPPAVVKGGPTASGARRAGGAEMGHTRPKVSFESDRKCPRCRMPSAAEVRAQLVELVRTGRRLGVDSFVLMIGLISLAMYVLRSMLSYLQAELGVALPSGASVAGSIFAFADAHPLLFLCLCFGSAIAIGAAVLFLDELRELARQLRTYIRTRMLPATAALPAAPALRPPRARRASLQNGGYTQLTDAGGSAAADGDGAACDGSLHGGAAMTAAMENGSFKGSFTQSSPSLPPPQAPPPPPSASQQPPQQHMPQPPLTATHHQVLASATIGVDMHVLGVEKGADGASGDPSADGGEMSEMMMPATLRAARLQRQLLAVTDLIEELDIKTRVLHRKSASAVATAARAELKALQAQRDKLRAARAEVLHGPATASGSEASDAARRDASTAASSEPGFFGKMLHSAVMQIVTRSANGIFSVTIYFADLISDVQVRSAGGWRVHVHAGGCAGAQCGGVAGWRVHRVTVWACSQVHVHAGGCGRVWPLECVASGVCACHRCPYAYMSALSYPLQSPFDPPSALSTMSAPNLPPPHTLSVHRSRCSCSTRGTTCGRPLASSSSSCSSL